MVLRLLVRLTGFIWAVALALLALGIAMYCLDGLVSLGGARPDRLVHLVRVREEVGRFLHRLEASGHLASLAFACGAAALIAGLALGRGLLRPPRQRLALLDAPEDGELGARRRALRQIAKTLTADAEGVEDVRRVALALRRNGAGGRLRLDVTLASGGEASVSTEAIEAALAPVCEPFKLERRVHARAARERVESSR